jgi:hypothetical protein
MALIFEPPNSPLDLVRGHWLLERLAEKHLAPDPEKIRKIFSSTIPKDGFLYDLLDHSLQIESFMKRGKYQAVGKKIALAYEKAISVFKKSVADPKFADLEVVKSVIKELTEQKDYYERMYFLTPSQDFFSVQQTISQQAFLLFDIMAPLIKEANATVVKHLPQSSIHIFIADLLAIVYYDHENLTPAKIKGMVKDIRRTSSKKKLADLRRLVK